MMRRRWLGGLSLVILNGLSSPIHAQETLGNFPIDSIKAFITSDGEIVYYAPVPEDVAKSDELAIKFKQAMKSNIGMQEFIKDNPESYLGVGKGRVVYTMTADEVSQGTFEAESVVAGYPAGESPQEFGTVLNPAQTSSFLSRLAGDMLQDVKRLGCGASVRPRSIEGSASIGGIISFAATWDVSDLCD